MATDSAVTISSSGRTKVFDTADKLFELSAIHPVAIMINGNMDCLGVPWEVIVKDFRSQHSGPARDSVASWMDDFLKFVEIYPGLSETDTQQYIVSMVDSEITWIQQGVSEQINEIFYNNRRKRKKRSIDINELILNSVNFRRKEYECLPKADSLKEIGVDVILERYTEILDERISARFPPVDLSEEQKAEIKLLIAESLLSSQASEFSAGIVVAGYGGRDTFPSVRAVEVEGKIVGKLKVSFRESLTIADAVDHGRVIYFAQTDVIERLLRGADPLFVDKTAEFIRKAVKEVAESIEFALRSRKRTRQKIQPKSEETYDELANEVADEYRMKAAETLKARFAREFDRMIAMMPKQEVIELAEALVSITAVERKASSDQGTVGGPIDVAFISKNDGFVWIKRKHYFKKDLNPRYFWRKYGMGQPGEAS